MISENLSEDIVSHISRDATEIEVREKPPKETKAEAESDEKKPKRKLGRPKKGEESVKAPTRPRCIGAVHDAKGNAGGFAASVCCGHEDEQQGLQRVMDRIQTSP